jgi:hypothetical protein
MTYTRFLDQNKECAVIKNNKFSLIHPILFTLIFCISSYAYSDSLPLKPGLWKTTTMTTSPMGTQTKTSSQCLKDKFFDPRKSLADADGCEVTNSKLSGDTLNFTMECRMDVGKATMNGRYTSKGDTGSGTIKINMSFGGQVMSSETQMQAERVGDCTS